MDEGDKPAAHTCGAGQQQQQQQQQRPFFYVQPPSQPYLLLQHWQMNNPYSHFGLSAGLNFARPCVPPYQYMQYPSFVFPQAPIYPVDHRRMFEPRFYTPNWVDPQHRPQPHPPGCRRETASSGAQTEPNDAISKLIECLDKIRVGELPRVESRELDSGVASQTSGMFSPGEERKAEERGDVLPEVPDSGCFQSAKVEAECTQSAVVDRSSRGCWSGEVEDEPPLDSSSLHGECSSTAAAAAEELFSPVDKSEVTDIQSDTSVAEPVVPRCGVEELLRAAQPSSSSSPSSRSSSPSRFSSSVLKDAHSSTRVLQDKNEAPEEKYQILKLPFDGLLSTGEAAAGQLSPPAGSYYYVSMHATHERMSVLSPSLEELSSRDEMFSTDLDDADLFPKHAYTGRRLLGVVGVSPKASEEVWLQGPKRCVCTCCGKNLSKATGKSKGALWAYRDEGGDSEEDSHYSGGGGGSASERPIRVLVRKHSLPKKPHCVPPRPKAWYRRGLYQDQDCAPLGQDREGPEVAAADGAAEMADRLCRDGLSTSEQRLEDGSVLPRRRASGPPQRLEASCQRNVMYHRSRDDEDDDDELLRWERSSLVRGEPRS